jgi:hypothetical protein
MKKSITVSRLPCFMSVLVASVAVMATVDIASAKGDHHHGNTNGATPQFVISGQPAGVKRVQRDSHGDKHQQGDKYTGKKQKGCKHIIVPTAECGVSSKDPVGNTHPGGATSQTGGGTTISKGPSPGPVTFSTPASTPVTLSNGVTTSTIFYGKGLTVTSTSPGTITVSNGNSSVTMPGGSLTLRGAPSVGAASGLQLVRLSNGDVSVAVSPVLISGTKSAPPPPGGVGFGDDLKFVGKGVGAVAATPVLAAGGVVVGVGGAIVGTAAGHPIKWAEDAFTSYVSEVGNWVSGWF